MDIDRSFHLLALAAALIMIVMLLLKNRQNDQKNSSLARLMYVPALAFFLWVVIRHGVTTALPGLAVLAVPFLFDLAISHRKAMTRLETLEKRMDSLEASRKNLP